MVNRNLSRALQSCNNRKGLPDADRLRHPRACITARRLTSTSIVRTRRTFLPRHTLSDQMRESPRQHRLRVAGDTVSKRCTFLSQLFAIF
jgi:hypothetical protein